MTSVTQRNEFDRLSGRILLQLSRTSEISCCHGLMSRLALVSLYEISLHDACTKLASLLLSETPLWRPTKMEEPEKIRRRGRRKQERDADDDYFPEWWLIWTDGSHVPPARSRVKRDHSVRLRRTAGRLAWWLCTCPPVYPFPE